MVLYCAILDDLGQGRAVVRLRGPDTRRFLQGSVSGNLDQLGPGSAVTAALLTVKGKLVSELVVLDSGDTTDLLVPRSEAEAVASAFEEHIVMDDVTVERVADASAAMVWDDDDVERLIALPGSGLQCARTRHPLPATLVVGPIGSLRSALAEAIAIDSSEFDRVRIESATPGWGAELRPGFFPPEIGFVYAVSYDKGCYLGQEPLARIHARGQVNRVMVRIVAESSTIYTWVGRAGFMQAIVGTAPARAHRRRMIRALGAGPSRRLGIFLGAGKRPRLTCIKNGRHHPKPGRRAS